MRKDPSQHSKIDHLLNFYCISTLLFQLAFEKCLSDCGTFILDHGYDTCVIVIVYVDDMILASRFLQAIQRVKRLISDRFEINDLGQLKYYLGLNIETHKDHRKRKILVKVRRLLHWLLLHLRNQRSRGGMRM
jgi:hypothetical protein